MIPDLDDDAHDTPLSVADAWLEKHFGSLLNDSAFRQEVLLIVTFDEDGTRWFDLFHRKRNHIYAVFWGSGVRAGSKTDEPYNHYDLLRTIEALLAIAPFSTGDAEATPITGIWQ